MKSEGRGRRILYGQSSSTDKVSDRRPGEPRARPSSEPSAIALQASGLVEVEHDDDVVGRHQRLDLAAQPIKRERDDGRAQLGSAADIAAPLVEGHRDVNSSVLAHASSVGRSLTEAGGTRCVAAGQGEPFLARGKMRLIGFAFAVRCLCKQRGCKWRRFPILVPIIGLISPSDYRRGRSTVGRGAQTQASSGLVWLPRLTHSRRGSTLLQE
jgi:hypothetical protein